MSNHSFHTLLLIISGQSISHLGRVSRGFLSLPVILYLMHLYIARQYCKRMRCKTEMIYLLIYFLHQSNNKSNSATCIRSSGAYFKSVLIFSNSLLQPWTRLFLAYLRCNFVLATFMGFPEMLVHLPSMALRSKNITNQR